MQTIQVAMDNIIQRIQHPDNIWTWKESSRGTRQSVWLPYLESITKKPKSQNWLLAYNGGVVEADLKKIDFIMLYGGCGNLPAEFLDALNSHRICLSIHRRNMPRPYWFVPASGADEDDILTSHLVTRANNNKCTYVARTLVREKLLSAENALVVSGAEYKRLAATRNVEQVRQIEAKHASRYWTWFYGNLGITNEGITRRNFDHPVNSALDAGSFFMHGILLRWVLYHKLSPFHGFLHSQTGFPSLIYDLIEPYRIWIENSVIKAVGQVGMENDQTLVSSTISALKEMLDEIVYVPATRQTVRRKALLHGSVLAMRAWLIGQQTRFVVPVEGKKKGGRPPKVGFQLPGYKK